MVSGANALKGHIWNHGGSTFGPGSGPVCSGSWLADWQAGWPELLAACLTGWLAGCLGSPGHLGFETIFCLCSRMGSIFFPGSVRFWETWKLGQPNWARHRTNLGSALGAGSGPGCSRPPLAGRLAGPPERPELLAWWLTGWLAVSLDSPGQLGFGTGSFFVWVGVFCSHKTQRQLIGHCHIYKCHRRHTKHLKRTWKYTEINKCIKIHSNM
jgi:hypothetical protein